MVSDAALQWGPVLLAGWLPVMADVVVKGTLLLVVVFGLAQVLRRASAATRHLVWGLGLSGLLVLPLLSAVLPWRLAVPRPALAQAVGWLTAWGGAERVNAADPAGGGAAELAPGAERPEAPGAVAASTGTHSAESAPGPLRSEAGGAANAAAGDAAGRPSDAAPAPEAHVTAAQDLPASSSGTGSALPHRAADANVARAGAPGLAASLAALLVAVWLAGVVLSLARLGTGVFALRRLARRASPVVEASWWAPLGRVARRLGLRRPVRLLRSDDALLPMAWGVLRPVVVLPSAADEWTQERRLAVLLHELAHVRRRDVAVHLLGRAACALYWFHPLARLAARRLRSESERACDDLVLGAGTRPSEYAEHLLEIAQVVGRVRSPAAALAFGQRSDFEGRLLAILDPVARRSGLTRVRAWILTVAVALVLLPLAAIGPARAGSARDTDGVGPAVDATAQEPGAAPGRQDARAAAGADVDAGVQEPADAETGPDVHGGPDADAADGARTHVEIGGAGVEVPEHQARTAEEATRRAREIQDVAAHVVDKATRQQQEQERSAAVPALIEALRDPDPEVRLAVVRTLADIEDARAVEPLVVLFADESVEVRRAVVHALGQIEDPRAVAALSQALLQDADAEVRRMSAWALGQIEHASAVPALSAALREDADAEVRRMSAWALGQIESVDAVDALGAALGDTSVEVRRTAVWALGQIEDARAVPALLPGLVDEDAEIRRQSAWALGQIESGEAVDPLLAALQDPDAEVRRRAAWALGEIEDVRAAAGLAAALRDGDVEVRRTAARALGELDLREAPPVLLEALSDEDVEVRRAAARALGEIEDPAAVGPLSNALRDADVEVRRNALRALSEIRSPAALQVLIDALQDEDPEIRRLAAKALGSR